MIRALSVIIAFSFALVVGAESQPPAPSPVEKSEQEKPTGAQNEAKPSENKNSTKKPAVSNPPQVSDKDSSPNAKERDEKASSEWGNLSELATAIFTGLLFLATVVLAIFTFGLWSSGGKNAKKQLRAYVALEDIYFVWENEFVPLPQRTHTNIERIRVKNYGPTRASGMSIHITRTKNRDRPIFVPIEVSNYTLPPGQRFGRTLREDMEFFKDKNPFWTHGMITYCDIYDLWWVTEFCFEYVGNGRFVPDPEHNREHGPYKSRDKAIRAS